MVAACPSHGSKQRIEVAFDAKRTLNDGQSGPIVRQVERTFPPAPRRPLIETTKAHPRSISLDAQMG